MRGKIDISETEGVGGSIETGKRLTFLSAKCDYRCTVAACGASRTAVCGGLGRERFTEIVIGSSRDAVFVVDLLMSVGMDP
jgi:hypothetical protein